MPTPYEDHPYRGGQYSPAQNTYTVQGGSAAMPPTNSAVGRDGPSTPMTHSELSIPSLYMPAQFNSAIKGSVSTKVIRRQGPRGILPSATGTTENTTITQDAAGKFKCPRCPKTYAHYKHAKRHLLRHTGERPYPCVRCGDAFTRSDIRNRHVSRCSGPREEMKHGWTSQVQLASADGRDMEV